MIGTLIGAGTGIASSVVGGILGASSARKRARALAEERRKNKAWYERRYNEDFTQRADAQAALARMREAMRERSESAAGTAAVMGSGSEAEAQEKEAQNKALAEATQGITAAGEQSKERIESTYRQRDADLAAQQDQAEQAKSQAIAGAVTAAGSAAGGISNLLSTNKKQ